MVDDRNPIAPADAEGEAAPSGTDWPPVVVVVGVVSAPPPVGRGVEPVPPVAPARLDPHVRPEVGVTTTRN